MGLKLIMMKQGNALLAQDEFAYEDLRKIKDGTIVKVELKHARSLQQLKLLHALLRVVYDAQSEPQTYPTETALLDALKVATGHFDYWTDLEGNLTQRPKSIDMASMDQKDFNAWFEQVIKIIIERVIPNCPKAGLEDQVYSMLKMVTQSQFAAAQR